MEALKILKGGVPIGEACRYTYCLREPTRKGLYLLPTPLEKPAKSCFVCNTSTVSPAWFRIDSHKNITLQQFDCLLFLNEYFFLTSVLFLWEFLVVSQSRRRTNLACLYHMMTELLLPK